MEKGLKSLLKLAVIIGGGIILQYLFKRSQSHANNQTIPYPPNGAMRVTSPIVLPPEAFSDDIVVPHPPKYTNGAHLPTDDLTEIDSINVEAAQALQKMGITRFVDLARANAIDLYQELADLPASYELIEHWISAAKERVTSR